MSKLLKMRRLFSERRASAALNAPIVGKQSGFVALTRADENYGLEAGAAICRSEVSGQHPNASIQRENIGSRHYIRRSAIPLSGEMRCSLVDCGRYRQFVSARDRVL